MFWISDSEFMDECGMDALCFARVMEFGLKLSLMGMLMAIWLIPVYKTAQESKETCMRKLGERRAKTKQSTKCSNHKSGPDPYLSSQSGIVSPSESKTLPLMSVSGHPEGQKS